MAETCVTFSTFSFFDSLHKLLWRNNQPSHPQHVAASSGSGVADLEKLSSILEAIPLIQYICLDVANGYSEHFVEFVKRVREKFPKHTIMVRFLSKHNITSII